MSKIEAIKEELKKAKESSQADHLEAVLYEFVKLHEGMSNDAHKRDAEVGGRIKQLTSQLKEFEKLAETVKNDIRASIRTEAENTAVYFGQSIGEAARKQIAPTVKKLEEASDEVRGKLARYYSELSSYKWVTIGMAALTTILTSLLIVKLLMPAPVMPLTTQQIDTYGAGEVFQSILPKLSARQRQWLFDVAKGKAKNHEKLVEDMKKDYAGVN